MKAMRASKIFLVLLTFLASWTPNVCTGAGDVDAILGVLVRDRERMPDTLERALPGEAHPSSQAMKQVSPVRTPQVTPRQAEEAVDFFPLRRTPGRIIYSGELR